MILSLWLGENVPEYTVVFTRIVLLTALISTYANPTSCIAYATGKIKTFNIVVSGLNLLIVPIAYLFLKLGFGPESTMIVSLIMSVMVQIVRLFVLRKLLPFSIRSYFMKVVIPTVIVFILSPILPYLCKHIMQNTPLSSFIICFISVLSVVMFAWLIGLNKEEKNLLISKIKFIKKSIV
ncbi:MAG: hypothetical protein IKL08_02860 [Clostridia bacterium]|nr:hypothetical protein [Clostridia bacterium]